MSGLSNRSRAEEAAARIRRWVHEANPNGLVFYEDVECPCCDSNPAPVDGEATR